jgi:hypothetical protein
MKDLESVNGRLLRENTQLQKKLNEYEDKARKASLDSCANSDHTPVTSDLTSSFKVVGIPSDNEEVDDEEERALKQCQQLKQNMSSFHQGQPPQSLSPSRQTFTDNRRWQSEAYILLDNNDNNESGNNSSKQPTSSQPRKTHNRRWQSEARILFNNSGKSNKNKNELNKRQSSTTPEHTLLPNLSTVLQRWVMSGLVEEEVVTGRQSFRGNVSSSSSSNDKEGGMASGVEHRHDEVESPGALMKSWFNRRASSEL